MQRSPGPYVDPYRAFYDAIEAAAHSAPQLWMQHRARSGQPTEEELSELAERFQNEVWIQFEEAGITWPD